MTGPRAIPYGVYDLQANTGTVFVGTSADTPAFAVDCIEKWWRTEGRKRYPEAATLQILADSGGSNGCRPRAWRFQLQDRLCNRHRLRVTVAHYPTAASKWNPIDHRLFSEISKNWARRPLDSYETILKYLCTTLTAAGSRVRAHLVKSTSTGVKITDAQMEQLHITSDSSLPKWNYTIEPASRESESILAPALTDGVRRRKPRSGETKMMKTMIPWLTLLVAFAFVSVADAQVRDLRPHGDNMWCDHGSANAHLPTHCANFGNQNVTTSFPAPEPSWGSASTWGSMIGIGSSLASGLFGSSSRPSRQPSYSYSSPSATAVRRQQERAAKADALRERLDKLNLGTLKQLQPYLDSAPPTAATSETGVELAQARLLVAQRKAELLRKRSAAHQATSDTAPVPQTDGTDAAYRATSDTAPALRTDGLSDIGTGVREMGESLSEAVSEAWNKAMPAPSLERYAVKEYGAALALRVVGGPIAGFAGLVNAGTNFVNKGMAEIQEGIDRHMR